MTRHAATGRIPPKIWLPEELEDDRRIAIGLFRRERLQEPKEQYLDEFDRFRSVVETLVQSTGDLRDLRSVALEILTDRDLLQGFRYLAGPPLSADDLQVVADAASLAPAALRADRVLVDKLIDTITDVVDQRRFPWLPEGRNATSEERAAAVIATTALIAAQRVQTARRTLGKSTQEAAVRQALAGARLTPQKILSDHIRSPEDWPLIGCFYGAEVTLVNRKADLLVRPWDGRIVPIECKVSNSSLNSVKRLNNDAAAKAAAWISDLGRTQVVPVAVLGGVSSRRSLLDAQDRGLMLVWSHRLADLTDWIEATRPG